MEKVIRYTQNGSQGIRAEGDSIRSGLEVTQSITNWLAFIVCLEAATLVFQNWETFSPFAHMAINMVSDVVGTIVEGGRGVFQYVNGDLKVQADLVEVGVSASQNNAPQQLYLRPEVAAPIQQVFFDIFEAFK